MSDGGNITEIIIKHGDGTTSVHRTIEGEIFDVGGNLPDKKVSIEVTNDYWVLPKINELIAALKYTKIPAMFTFELTSGEILQGLISEIKIIQIEPQTIKLELFGNQFKRIL